MDDRSNTHVIITKEAVADVDRLVRINWGFTTRGLEQDISMSKGSIHLMLRERLQYLLNILSSLELCSSKTKQFYMKFRMHVINSFLFPVSPHDKLKDLQGFEIFLGSIFSKFGSKDWMRDHLEDKEMLVKGITGFGIAQTVVLPPKNGQVSKVLNFQWWQRKRTQWS
ncbi:hypothetical protein HNY73_009912 [Argiope bruennichi]|uniref:Uncharacterized protein n=1 Tax=Argiope bruennichi TaxID=94029 RepID=A0A8T0FBX1_ARGBR|nr:hypothetical protein HNY73_009912 [Argiope bruennichi]